jgi:zinc transport system substrate-binding protein
MTSIIPQEYFVERIGGDKVRVKAMVDPGASPASYEPKPDEMAELARASVFFTIGVPFERAWISRMRSSNPELLFVDMAQDIRMRPITPGLHHNEDSNGLPDPHIWLSPPMVRIMAQTIRDTLAAVDPQNTQDYFQNFMEFSKEVDQLDQQLLGILEKIPAEKRSFLVFHPSWGYFARSYGLEQLSIEYEGKEPGAKQMARILEQARQAGIKTIFVQPEFSRRSAETLAQSLEARIVQADPLSRDWASSLVQMAGQIAADTQP